MYEQYTDKQIVEMLVPKLNKATKLCEWSGIIKYPERNENLIKAIATIYRSAYIRGQLGRSFIIGEKKERDSAIVFQVGDSVKLISRKGIDNESSRYFPPIGTTGEVVELGSDYCFVQWPKNTTYSNGLWACPNHFLEKVIEHWVPATKDNVCRGSNVRYINAEKFEQHSEFYSLPGTIGKVVSVIGDNTYLVQWPCYTTVQFVSRFDLEVLLCE